MNCRACSSANPDNAKFCSECGAPLGAACARCGAALERNARFCSQCGGPCLPAESPVAEGASPSPRPPTPDPRSYTPGHLAQRILTSRSALEGERKQVTVLFCDVVGFTSMAERADPEEMHALMDRYYQLVLAEVHRYEGTVNKFLGDGVLALFGAPVALEEAPRCAVLAALDIRRAVAELVDDVRERFGADFRVRIGIHSGTVVVGSIGDDLHMDYTAIGDTINLAARLQQNAEPGGILVSAATERLVHGYFDLRDRGKLQVKGKAKPVHAYEVLGERPATTRLEVGALSGLTPFVARDRELETIRNAADKVRARHGQVVFLVGEAGMGKSRLLYELHRQLGDDYVWIEGRCSSYGWATAFEPVCDAMRRSLRIEERDDDATVLRKLTAAVAELGATVEWTLPFMRVLLSLPSADADVDAMDPATRRSETVRALQVLLVRRSEVKPLVFVVEDLHWIDAASEEFLGFLAESIPATRVLLLLTHRPEYQQPFGERTYHVRVGLQSLSEDEMAQMTRGLLETAELPPELGQLIAAKAEGNPLFVEEVTKSLREDGVLSIDDGRIRLARDLATVSVPNSIQGVLMARIDRLDDEPKRAIQLASIIGREFALRLLERITETRDRLGPVVEELQALELIYEKASHPELAFMFKHALTHDVAYESVLLERRKTLHRIVGLAIEEIYSDRLVEHCEALAHHFERGEDWEKALLYHEKAAVKAAAAYANRSASEHCRKALEVCARLSDTVTRDRRRGLQEMLAQLSFCLSDFRAAGDAFVGAAELSDDAEATSLLLGMASYAYHWGHDYVRDRETVNRALEFSRANGVRVGEGLALLCQGFFAATDKGDIEVSTALIDTGVQLIGAHARAGGMAKLIEGEQAEWGGDFARALTLQTDAMAQGKRLSDPILTIEAAWIAGKAACCLGQYADSLTRLDQAVQLAERIGDRALTARLRNTIGWLYAEIGCHEIAAEYNRRASATAHEMVELGLVPGAPELYGNAAINLAGNLIELGELGAAQEHLATVREMIEGSSDHWMEWRYFMHLQDAEARLALRRGDADLALRRSREELEEARRTRAKKLEARALELHARALAFAEQPAEAHAALVEAEALARRIQYPPVIWRSRAIAAELYRRAGDDAGALQHRTVATGMIDALAAPLPLSLRRQFRAMGAGLVAQPLG